MSLNRLVCIVSLAILATCIIKSIPAGAHEDHSEEMFNVLICNTCATFAANQILAERSGDLNEAALLITEQHRFNCRQYVKVNVCPSYAVLLTLNFSKSTTQLK